MFGFDLLPAVLHDVEARLLAGSWVFERRLSNSHSDEPGILPGLHEVDPSRNHASLPHAPDFSPGLAIQS
jgi:hypothetical protein